MSKNLQQTALTRKVGNAFDDLLFLRATAAAALDQGDVNGCVSCLIGVRSQCELAHQRAIDRSDLLSQAAVVRLAAEIVKIFSEAIKAACDGDEYAFHRITDAFTTKK